MHMYGLQTVARVDIGLNLLVVHACVCEKIFECFQLEVARTRDSERG